MLRFLRSPVKFSACPLMAGTGPGGCRRDTDSWAVITTAGPRDKFGYRKKGEEKKENTSEGTFRFSGETRANYGYLQ